MIDKKNLESGLAAQVGKLAAQMHDQGYQRTDPVREIPALLGDRWSSLILLVLNMGVWRHAELRRVLGTLAAEKHISQRVLTLKLRALQRNGMLDRQATQEVPPRVSYALTPLGRSLALEAQRLIAWVQTHQVEVIAARAAFAAGTVTVDTD